MAIVHLPHVATPQRLHHPPSITRRTWRGQQVHMVGHQHAGMDRAVQIERDLAQVGEVMAAIVVGEEAGLSVDAALHDVQRHADPCIHVSG
jgi:hypothetical protein